MVSGTTGLTSSLSLFTIESVHPTWKSRQGHLFTCMKLIVTGVTKSQVLKKFSRKDVIVVTNWVICIVTNQTIVDSFCKCSLVS